MENDTADERAKRRQQLRQTLEEIQFENETEEQEKISDKLEQISEKLENITLMLSHIQEKRLSWAEILAWCVGAVIGIVLVSKIFHWFGW